MHYGTWEEPDPKKKRIEEKSEEMFPLEIQIETEKKGWDDYEKGLRILEAISIDHMDALKDNLLKAFDCFNKALEFDGANPEYLHGLGSAYWRFCEISDTLKIIEDIDCPKESLEWLSKNYNEYVQKAYDCFEKAYQLDGNNTSIVFSFGLVCLCQPKEDPSKYSCFIQAIECFEKCIEIDKKNPLYHYKLAQSYVSVGIKERLAAYHFEQCIELSVVNANSCLSVFCSCLDLNPHTRINDVIIDYSDLMKNFPEIFIKPKCYDKLIDYLNRAKSSIETALILSSQLNEYEENSFVESLNQITDFQSEIYQTIYSSQKKVIECKNQLISILRVNHVGDPSESSLLRLNLWKNYVATADFDNALYCFNAAYRLNSSTHVHLLQPIGDINLRIGNFRETVDIYDEIVKRLGVQDSTLGNSKLDLKKSLTMLAIGYYYSRRYREMIEILEGHEAEIFLPELGEAYLKMNDVTGWHRYWSKWDRIDVTSVEKYCQAKNFLKENPECITLSEINTCIMTFDELCSADIEAEHSSMKVAIKYKMDGEFDKARNIFEGLIDHYQKGLLITYGPQVLQAIAHHATSWSDYNEDWNVLAKTTDREAAPPATHCKILMMVQKYFERHLAETYLLQGDFQKASELTEHILCPVGEQDSLDKLFPFDFRWIGLQHKIENELQFRKNLSNSRLNDLHFKFR